MKNLRNLFITFVIFLFISGCQTVKQKTDAAIEKENKKLSEFIGQSASKLQMELGKPDEDFENEKGNFIFINPKVYSTFTSSVSLKLWKK